MDVEVVSAMWPEDLGKEGIKQFNMDQPGVDQDMLEEVVLLEEPSIFDLKRLLELTNYSEKGSSQLAYLVKQWEYKQANAIRLLNEELHNLSKQREEVEFKKLEIIEAHRFEEEKYGGDKRSVSILDEELETWETIPRRRNDAVVYDRKLEIGAEINTIKYWKQLAEQRDKMLEASIHREQSLMEKLQENIKTLERQSSPVEELSHILKRADNFLHFILQNAPVVIGHQDKELRYRFIYNHFPSLDGEDIIGKTDVEIFSGAGVKESQEFKKEVMERGLPAKREITFETELFGSKTFLIYVEPVFSKAGDTIGVNYMGMDITDQVIKREKMTQLREEIAVQKAKEKELNKTIHITEETMRAKQMLATMSHEIRSPLTGVVSMAEILANTKLDKEQRQLLDVMLSSGDLVLQLINDILDLSKVESGVMKLEATKFRPREVVKHVLQTAAASLQKDLTLEGHVADNVPVEVIGDVLRIRQILTNLISNAIKFTHKGKVGINLHVVPGQQLIWDELHQTSTADTPAFPAIRITENTPSWKDDVNQSDAQVRKENSNDKGERHRQPHGIMVWLRCDVFDTGIGIPENALPTLFRKYMQASAAHARKYGGTGLGLAICKQLVELMGGHLTVSSKEQCGSTFTFVLPCKVYEKKDSDDLDEVSNVYVKEAISDSSTEEVCGVFCFAPRRLCSLLSSNGCGVSMKKRPSTHGSFDGLGKVNGVSDESVSFPSDLERSVFYDKPPDNILVRGEGHQDIATGFVMDKFNSSSISPCSTQSISGLQHHSGITCTKVTNMHDKNSKNKGICKCMEQEKANRNMHSTNANSAKLAETKFQPKILLVEDNKINIMVTQSMMKLLGYSIDVVNNGLEAIHAVQHADYDLILMDVCMPVMDGLQATRLIRSYEENGFWDASVATRIDQAMPYSDSASSGPNAGLHRKRITIIAMTANALAESAAECLANGMDSFVSKPVTFQRLKQCLQKYFTC